jgi:hypothetical protein
LSAHAVAGSTADNLSIQLQAEFDLRLTTAIGPPMDLGEVHQILATSVAMGWTSTAAKAEAALAGPAPLRRAASGGGAGVIPGLPPITLHGLDAGAGTRPVLSWDPVDGAALYVVAVTVADGPSWAWQGSTTTVPYGGGPIDDLDTTAAQLAIPSTWFVTALDQDGGVLAASAAGQLTP